VKTHFFNFSNKSFPDVTLHQSIDVQRGKGVQYECPEIEAINDTRPDRLEIKKEIPQNRNVSLWKWKPFSAAHDSTLATRGGGPHAITATRPPAESSNSDA